MRICLFTPYSTGHHPQWMLFLARYLSECGDSVSVATMQPSQVWEPILDLGPSVRLTFLSGSSSSNGDVSLVRRRLVMGAGLRSLMAHATREDVQIVHNLYLDRAILEHSLCTNVSYLPFKVFGTLFWPYFFSSNGDQKTFSRRLLHGFESSALKSLLRTGKLEKLFVLRESIKNGLEEHWGTKNDAGIVAIPDPVFSIDQQVLKKSRSELGLSSDIPVIAYLGNLSHEKGVDLFLDALPRVEGKWIALMRGRPLNLDKTQIDDCRRRLGPAQRLMTTLEYISEDEWHRSFCSADLVVMPYRRCFKGPSGILQTAAAAGKPVVCADVNEIGRTVREHQLGLLCEPESPDALARAISHALKTREALTARVLPHALRYSEANDSRLTAERIRHEYEKALQ